MICPKCGYSLSNTELKIFPYMNCETCRILVNTKRPDQSYMVNEKLKLKNRQNLLIREQIRIVKKNIPKNANSIMDFGCGIGSFLYFSKSKLPLDKFIGIEITPESRNFANINNVEVFEKLQNTYVSIVTFWHSLEHIPGNEIITILQKLRQSNAKVIILSVPNFNSIGLKIIKNKDPFYDEFNHPFIYSKDYLNKVFNENGYILKGEPIIISYTFFGAIQSLLNLLFNSHNALYNHFKRGQRQTISKLFLNLLALPILIPISLIITVYICIYPKKDFVINHIYQSIK